MNNFSVPAPYGVGTPAVEQDLGGAVLRSPSTAQRKGSRKIDPATRDYVLDDTCRVAGMDDVQQLVLLAVHTTKGSSAMRSLGQELKKIDRITPNFARRVEDVLRSAVQHLTNAKLISVVNAQVRVVRPGVAIARLRWRDIATGLEQDTESSPIGQQ